MLTGIPKISVRIITYNQEQLIKRAIDSILPQRDYVYEICVSDDCSTDHTWDVLLQYDKDYPGLFKLNRNENNVGMFINIGRTKKLVTGDIEYVLAGDDEVGEGWFKAVAELVMEKKLDAKNDSFCIYGDYEARYPNGDTFVFRNNLVDSDANVLKLALRGLIGNRSCCWSVAMAKRFVNVSQGRSHIAEDAQDRQLQVFSDMNFYIPKVGNIYYAYVGVSAHMDEETMKERAKIRPYAISIFETWGVKLDKKDLIYSLEYFPAFERMVNKPTFGRVLKVIWLWLKSRDPKIKVNWNQSRSFIFAIRRRLPHRKPLHFN